jgi:hypothetical protein
MGEPYAAAAMKHPPPPPPPPPLLAAPPVDEVTVRVVLPEIEPEVAVMLEVPTATAVARPLLLTVATRVLDEFQVTCVVISWLVPSEYVPEAANCWVFPPGTLGLAGDTDMEDRVGMVLLADKVVVTTGVGLEDPS